MKSCVLLLAVLALGHATVIRSPPPAVKEAGKEVASKKATPAVTAKAQPAPVTEAAKTKKADKAPAKVASLIEPALKDVSSDKKFFGPPFPADYPDDKRPVVQKSILDKLKGPEQPYPALQSKNTFDKDFVKDENSDKGGWKAQFEYDTLRKKLMGEEADEKSAEEKAAKEGRDADDAQSKADKAAKDAADAQKEADEAGKEDGTGKDEDGGEKGEEEAAMPSDENLQKLKKQVADAEANLAKEKKEFAECKKQLEAAEQAVKDLKAQQLEMEQQLAGETKLWAETKAVRLNLHKAKVDASHAKTVAAQAKLQVALNTKADVDRAYAKEKAESDRAKENLEKERADLKQAKSDLEKATLRLQKLRGYSPADTMPVKSSARMTSAFAFLMIGGVCALF